MRRGDEGFDGKHDATEIRKPGVGTEHSQTVDAAHALTAVDQHGVVLAALDHAVGDLLLERFGDVACTEHVFGRGQRRTGLDGQVASDANQPTEFTKAQGKFAPSASTALGLAENDGHGTLIEVRNFTNRVLVSQHLLCDETNETATVSRSVGHLGVHIDLVAVPTDTASQRRMHTLNGVEVPCSDENEIARHRLGLGQGTGGALRPTGDGEGTVLHGREQRLLLLKAKQVDFVDVENTLVGSVDGTGLNTVVGRCFHTTRLERVVTNVAKQ